MYANAVVGSLRSAACAAKKRLSFLGGTSGAQLLEVALSLPFLMALVVGATDFGGAYKLQHDLNNACREGARFASSESMEDLNCGSSCGSSIPASVTAVRDVVANYLTQTGLTSCAVTTTASYSAVNQTWTFTSSSTGCSSFSLTIARAYSFANTSGTTVLASQVTLAYPYSWTYGKVAGMLGNNKKNGQQGQGNNISLPAAITSSAIMENLS